MQVDYDTAVAVFENNFADHLTSPYLHPFYVSADAKRDDVLSPVFFVFTEGKNTFYYAFHMSRVPGPALWDIQSPYGYGGPLFNTAEPVFLERAWAVFSHWCHQNSILAEFVRFHPLLDNGKFFAGDVMPDREIVWLDLTEQDLLPTYSTRARTTVRKAQKNGLKVEWWSPERFIAIFPALYLAHMQELKADSYYFFSENYFRPLIFWSHVQLAVCTLNEEVLAAAIFLQGPDYMEYHLSAATKLGKQLGATNLVIHEAALRGKHFGCKVLNLGGGTDATPNNPLFFFKSGFSERRATFSIGKRIHLPKQYHELQKTWEEENKRSANKILFYR
jgi:hypothetical protein